MAEESIVLLKNDEGILPLRENQKVAFIGKYAKAPRYQGVEARISTVSGSILRWEAYEADQRLDNGNLLFAQGYIDEEDYIKQELLDEAVDVAKQADTAVIFAGLPDSFESEGYDRKHMRMPECQQQLIQEVAKVQPNTVVVLHNGAPVEMPWIGNVKGVLEAYLGGQAVGAAVLNILFGRVNPSGHLAETFPLRLPGYSLLSELWRGA